MKWKVPHKVKVYEALGVLSDNRIEINKQESSEAKLFSSSGNKFYTIKYDKASNSIFSNDNAAYWQGTLGYPAIAYLLKTGEIKFKSEFAKALKGIKWKDINTKFKNDFEKTVNYANEIVERSGVDLGEFLKEVDRIFEQINALELNKLDLKFKPPTGY